MQEILIKLAPVFIGFGLAFAAKKLRLLKSEHGNLLLKFSFFVTIPALVFVSVSKIGFSHSLLLFPLLPAITLLATFPVATVVAKRLRLPRPSEGTMRVAPLTINTGLALAFLVAAFGAEGATRVVLFNAGFNPLLFIFVYGLAASYNPATTRRRDVLKRILILPPLWALIVGLLVNVSDTTVPSALMSALQTIGNITPYLTIVALGLLFNPQRFKFDKTLAIVGVRIGVGLAAGLLVCGILHLDGLNRLAVLMLCSAPVGFNVLTFAVTEKLDRELAANALSLSLPIGLILMPLIIILFA